MQLRSMPTSKLSASFITLQEGFEQFSSDLNKLEVSHILLLDIGNLELNRSKQFADVNATAFSKILKKVSIAISSSDTIVLIWYSGTKPQRCVIGDSPLLRFIQFLIDSVANERTLSISRDRGSAMLQSWYNKRSFGSSNYKSSWAKCLGRRWKDPIQSVQKWSNDL